MILGLDIGRQYVKAVVLDKTKGGHKLVNHGLRLVSEPNQTLLHQFEMHANMAA